jgi:hypothetical protein
VSELIMVSEIPRTINPSVGAVCLLSMLGFAALIVALKLMFRKPPR